MLHNMDNVVEWMNQVRQHGGIEEAEAARVATAENSKEGQSAQNGRRPALDEALQT